MCDDDYAYEDIQFSDLGDDDESSVHHGDEATSDDTVNERQCKRLKTCADCAGDGDGDGRARTSNDIHGSAIKRGRSDSAESPMPVSKKRFQNHNAGLGP